MEEERAVIHQTKLGLGVVGLAVLAVGMCSAGAVAGPTFGFQISGSTELTSTVGAANLVFDNSGFGIQGNGYGSGGGFYIEQVGAFDVLRPELFSDPDVTPTPLVIGQVDTGTFAYYGIARTLDANGGELDKRVYAAMRPGVGVGLSLAAAFDGFLTSHAPLTTTELMQAIEDGPDFPTPGGNQLAIDLIDYVFGGNLPGGNAKINTAVQAGETFDLILFDPVTGIGAAHGSMRVAVVAIPEPGALGLVGVVGLGLVRRRR